TGMLSTSGGFPMPWSGCGFLLVLCVSPMACLMVSSCPAGCCCPRPGLLVLCESLGLLSLPRSVPLSTSALSVARNQLCNIDNLLRPFSDLQELSLSHNQLSRFPRGLPPRAFQGLNKLAVLTLKGNKLTSLPRNLPDSLILVNLQVLKINSNCLRSVPDSAFDTLPRLRSVNLSNNLWVCECDILYLYRWLLSGRIKMATDLVCTEPLHLAHRLLLNLSVMAICPRVLMPKRTAINDALEQSTQFPTESVLLKTSQNVNDKFAPRLSVNDSFPSVTKTRVHPGHYSLETLSYEECMSLNTTPSVTPLYPETTAFPTDEKLLCRYNVTGQPTETNVTSTEETRALLSTNRDSPWPTVEPGPLALKDSTVITALLALLCVLVAMLMLAVLIVLKKILLRHQRVAPLETGSGR
uniref:Si:ch211-191d15.2 n=1 Tax=Neogobius melanostomus TaxID=47308 RepID=A0A8C6WZ53_9GOBI